MPSILKKMSQKHVPSCGAVILAAGSSSRMQGVDKMLAEIAGKSVIARTLDAFEQCPLVRQIVVVTRSDLILPIGDLVCQEQISKVAKVVEGGRDRARSALNGMAELDRNLALIAIHDGARPFVSQAVLERTIKAAGKASAAAPAIPVKDTVREAKDHIATATPDRSTLFAVQTPQVFDADLIRGALHHCVEHGIPLTDDCAAVEAIGKQVLLTEGDEKNLKITTRLDLIIGEAIAACIDQP